MRLLRARGFKGIIPRLHEKHHLPADTAQTAQNVKLFSGRLETVSEPLEVTDVGAGKQSLYYWRRNDSGEWLTWTTDVDVVKGPIADDSYDRIYYIDDGTLKVRGWDGGSEERDVGISAPAAPSASASYIFDPSTMTGKAEMATTCQWGTSSISDIDGDLVGWNHRDDGKLEVTFEFPAQVFTQIGPSTSTWYWNPYFRIYYGFQLTVPGVGSLPTVLIANMTDIKASTLSLSDGGDQYATFEVEDIQISGLAVTWNYTKDQDDLTGVPSNQMIRPQSSEFSVKFLIDMHYLDFAPLAKYSTYVQTYVDDWGEESPASTASDIVTQHPGQKVTIAGIADPGGNVTKRRLYRSAAGEEVAAFYYLDEQTSWSTDYDDTTMDADLGDELKEFQNPESGMSGLISMPGGYLAAFKEKTLYMSEPNLPYSWRDEYELTTDFDIVALCPISGNEYAVLTKGNPYIVSATTPDTATMMKLPLNQACVAKRSVARTRNTVAYASPDGIVLISGGQARVATEPFYRKDDWDAITPSSLIASVYDGSYHGWADGSNIIFDFGEKRATVTTTDETATGVWNDIETDKLYIIQGTKIYQWDAGTDPLKITWKSKEFRVGRPWRPKVAKVESDSYPADGSGTELTLKIYAEGTLVATWEVFDDNAFLLERLRPERVWSFQIESYHDVTEIALAASMDALKVD